MNRELLSSRDERATAKAAHEPVRDARATLTVEWVEWLDPRAVQQRELMMGETTAMYADRQAALDEAGRLAVNVVLTVSPDDISHTLLVHDGDTVIGHAALRPWGSLSK